MTGPWFYFQTLDGQPAPCKCGENRAVDRRSQKEDGTLRYHPKIVGSTPLVCVACGRVRKELRPIGTVTTGHHDTTTLEMDQP